MYLEQIEDWCYNDESRSSNTLEDFKIRVLRQSMWVDAVNFLDPSFSLFGILYCFVLFNLLLSFAMHIYWALSVAMEVGASSKACGPPPAIHPVFGTSHPATAQTPLPAVPANDVLEFESGCLLQSYLVLEVTNSGYPFFGFLNFPHERFQMRDSTFVRSLCWASSTRLKPLYFTLESVIQNFANVELQAGQALSHVRFLWWYLYGHLFQKIKW